jgi:hypothetical protein
VAFGGEQRVSLAQTVRVDARGQLVEIRMQLRCNDSANVNLEIASVASDGRPIGRLADAQSQKSSPAFDSIAFTLESPLQVNAADQLAIVLTTSSSASTCYVGGAVKEYSDGASWSRDGSGQAWTAATGDLGLRVLALP